MRFPRIVIPGWLKYNGITAAVATGYLRIRTRGLEKVIFTATTGRTGTLTLARLFSDIPDCVAFHEPYPIMNGPVLHAATYGNPALVDRVYRQVKLINILRAAAGHRYYFEGNHLFLKTFMQRALKDFGDRLRVIHLVRPPVEVAMSIYCLEHQPGTEIGNFWWLDYWAPTNRIKIADVLESDPEFSHPFYKALWYWYEFEARLAACREAFPSVKFTRFETEWFNDRLRVFALFDELGIPYDKAHVETLVGRREHSKADKKTVAPLPPELADRMHRNFQALIAQRGFWVESPNATPQAGGVLARMG